jgi:hypothetical protein
MKSSHWAAIAIAVVVVGLIVYFQYGSEQEVIDLLAQFETAEKRPPDAFKLVDVSFEDEPQQCVRVDTGSRLVWTVTVPRDAWLRVSLALDPSVWEKEGDGVLFLVAAGDGRSFDELAKQRLNPQANPNDRRRVPMLIDLSAYAGEEIMIFFNTYPSGPGEAMDDRNDAALWCNPGIFTR